MSWENCIIDSDYEICTEYPYRIRKISNKRFISEWNNGNGYIRLNLNGKKYYKHVIEAKQWKPNPDNLPYVDHINRDRSDNHLSNLRWISASDNNINKSGNNGYKYTLIDYDDAPDDLIEVDHYNQHEFENYYYSINENRFYFDTGLYYRELPVLNTVSGSAFVNMNSKKGKLVHIYFTKFKKMYQIE